MPNQSVTLDQAEWNVVMTVLSTGPWNQVNSVLMKIGAQLQAGRHAADGLRPGNVAVGGELAN